MPPSGGGNASLLGGETDRVFFTAGGTEADNWVIFAAAELIDGYIRISLSHENTQEEICKFITILPSIIKELGGRE